MQNPKQLQDELIEHAFRHEASEKQTYFSVEMLLDTFGEVDEQLAESCDACNSAVFSSVWTVICRAISEAVWGVVAMGLELASVWC